MRRFALLFFFLAAVGAAARDSAPKALWIDVPFVHQPREGCGAASLAMVMQYWAQQQGRVATGRQRCCSIQRQLYSPAKHGILASSMTTYLRAHGFKVFALNGRWSDLETQLAKGRPLIVALRPQAQRELHYVVVDGIDPARGLVMMNDPEERKLLSKSVPDSRRSGARRKTGCCSLCPLLRIDPDCGLRLCRGCLAAVFARRPIRRVPGSSSSSCSTIGLGGRRLREPCARAPPRCSSITGWLWRILGG